MLYLNVQHFNKDNFKTKFDTTIHYYNALNIVCTYNYQYIYINNIVASICKKYNSCISLRKYN